MAGLFILGVFLLVGGLYGIAASERTWHFLASLAVVMVAVVFLLCSAPLRTYEKPESPKPVAIEYPASEYELKLRIVEFEDCKYERDARYKEDELERSHVTYSGKGELPKEWEDEK